MNEIERAIRELQLYIDVRWGRANDMFNLALAALREKAERSSTMAKAVLELPDMPENCSDCDLHAEYCEWAGAAIEKWCPICDCKSIPKKGRRPDCPLKLVEGKEDE